MAQVKFGFDSIAGGKIYSIPYFMSAFLTPLLGFVVDKIGKRALFIMISSILGAIACFWVAILPDYTSPNFIIIGPEILMGICYSIFASALWSSIPYLVQARTIGSAFGMTTSLQNLGLVIAPYLSGALIDKYPGNYTPVMCLLGGFALCGLMFNIVLYIDDIKNRGSILDKVPKKTETISALMATPV